MANILILGCSGFIGRALAKELSKDNNIIGFDRIILPELQSLNSVKLISGDFIKQASFDFLLKGIDIVIHLICTTIPKDDTDTISREITDNLVPTINLLESMVRCNVKDIIFASSAGTVYGETGDIMNSTSSCLNPRCGYGVLKKVTESYLQFYNLRYGINHRIMRITNPYGWGQNKNKVQGLVPILVNKIISGEEIEIWGDGENMRDYIFMDDLLQAFRKMIRYSGEQHIFNIGYGKYYSISEVLEKIKKESKLDFVSVKYLPARFCDVKKSFIDLDESHNELKWYPNTDLDLGIRLTIDHLMKEVY